VCAGSRNARSVPMQVLDQIVRADSGCLAADPRVSVHHATMAAEPKLKAFLESEFRCAPSDTACARLPVSTHAVHAKAKQLSEASLCGFCLQEEQDAGRDRWIQDHRDAHPWALI
jgi:hypothetical protein